MVLHSSHQIQLLLLLFQTLTVNRWQKATLPLAFQDSGTGELIMINTTSEPSWYQILVNLLFIEKVVSFTLKPAWKLALNLNGLKRLQMLALLNTQALVLQCLSSKVKQESI